MLGRRGWLVGLLVLCVELAAASVPLLVGGSLALYPLLLAVATGVGLIVHCRNAVRLEPDALVVVSTGASRRYPWADVLEASWTRGTGFMGAWSGPVLRVRGGPYDEPGPNLPGQVASLVLFGRRANEEAERHLAEAATSHGVAYTPDLVKLINTGQRRPRLPGEG